MKEVWFVVLLIGLASGAPEPMAVSLNARRVTHVLDPNFISININPSDLLLGKPFGVSNNSTLSILRGLAPAYVRLGGHDTNRYAFKNTKNLEDYHLASDYIISEDHWRDVNDLLRQTGLDVVVCLNSAFRTGPSQKWDPRNALQLITFSDKQGYNITWELGYEPLRIGETSGTQLGKDISQLRAILNAFPRYQQSNIVGPDLRILHRKDDVDNAIEVLMEAGPSINAVTWHPRWPHASAITPSDASDNGYEFPPDYLEWDHHQLHKLLQRALLKKPFWISEPKAENLGSFAEGLIYARRLSLAAKLGIDVVMKHPSLNDISHPKPEYWVALLHKRTLGQTVLDARSVSNNSDVSVVIQCTSNSYSSTVDGGLTVFAVNTAGVEHRLQVKGISQIKIGEAVHQYVLTGGQEPTDIFSQMTYLNNEPLLMSEDGLLPDLNPKIKRMGQSLITKLPPYAIGFWVMPQAKIKMCQQEPQSLVALTLDELNAANIVKTTKKEIHNLRNLTHTLVNNLLSPIVSTDEVEDKKESLEEVTDKRRISRQTSEDKIDLKFREIIDEIKKIVRDNIRPENLIEKGKHDENNLIETQRIDKLADNLNKVIKGDNQEKEFQKFLKESGLNEDIAKLIVEARIAEGKGSKANKRRSKRQINMATIKLQEEHNDLAEIEKRFRKIIAKHRKTDLNPLKTQNLQYDKINKELQEDMLLKEITLLEKTEEALGEVMKIHQERHEAVEELLHDELEQMKEEKLASLMEIKKEPVKERENAFFRLNNLKSALLNNEEKMPPAKRETGDTRGLKLKNSQPFTDVRSYLDKRRESLHFRQKSLIKPLTTTENVLATKEVPQEPLLKIETTTEQTHETTILLPNTRKRLEHVIVPSRKYTDEFNPKKKNENIELEPEVEDNHSSTASPIIKKTHTFRGPRTEWRKPGIEVSKESKPIIKRSDQIKSIFESSDDKFHGEQEPKIEISKARANFGIANAAKVDSRELYRKEPKREVSKDRANFGIGNAAKIDSRELYRQKHETIDDTLERKTFFRQPEWKEHSIEGKFDSHDIDPTYISPEKQDEGTSKKSRAAEFSDRTIDQGGEGNHNEPEQPTLKNPSAEVIPRKTNREETAIRTSFPYSNVQKQGGNSILSKGKLNSIFEPGKHPEKVPNEREIFPGPVSNQFIGEQVSVGKPRSEKPEIYSTIDQHVERSKTSHYTEESANEKSTDRKVQVHQQSITEKSDRLTFPEESTVKESVGSTPDKSNGPVIKQPVSKISENYAIEKSTITEQFNQKKPVGFEHSSKQAISQFNEKNAPIIKPSHEKSEGNDTNKPIAQQQYPEKSGDEHTSRPITKQPNEEISKEKTTPDRSILKPLIRENPGRHEHSSRQIIKPPTYTTRSNAKQSTQKKSEEGDYTIGPIAKQSNEEKPINEQSVPEVTTGTSSHQPAVKVSENGEPNKSDGQQKSTTERPVTKHSSVESNKQTNRQKIIRFKEGHKSKPHTDGVAKEKPETTVGSKTTEGLKHENETTTRSETTSSPEKRRSKRDAENTEKTSRINQTLDDGNSSSSEERTSNSIIKLPANNTGNRPAKEENVGKSTLTFLDDLLPKTIQKAKEAIDGLHLPEYLHNFEKMMENISNVDNVIKYVAVPAHVISEHVQKIDRIKRETENGFDIIPNENSLASSTLVPTSSNTEKFYSTTADSSDFEFLKLENKLDAIVENETALDRVLEKMAETIVNNETASHNAYLEKNMADERTNARTGQVNDYFTEMIEPTENNGLDSVKTPENSGDQLERLGNFKGEKYETSMDNIFLNTLETTTNGIEPLEKYNEQVTEKNETSTKQQAQEINETELFESNRMLEQESHNTSTEKLETHPYLTTVDVHETSTVSYSILTKEEGISTEQQPLEIQEIITQENEHLEIYQKLQAEKHETSTEQQPLQIHEILTQGVELPETHQKLQSEKHETSTEQLGILETQSSGMEQFETNINHKSSTVQEEIENKKTAINSVNMHETSTMGYHHSIEEIQKDIEKNEDHLEEEITTEIQSKEHKIKKYKKHKHRYETEQDDPLSPGLQLEQSIIEDIIRKLLGQPLKENKTKRNILQTKTSFKRSTNEPVQKGYPILPQPGDASEILSQLKPGVYVIPSKDMTNVRAEQVTRSAGIIKPGKKIPNILSLNIFYDKKPETEIENNAVDDGNRFYDNQKWAKQPVMPPYALPTSVMQPLINQQYKHLKSGQQRNEQQYKTILPMQPVQPIIQPPVRNIYNRYPPQPQYSNLQPPLMDPYLINQQPSNYYYQQPREEKIPEILPISSWSKPQPNLRKNTEEMLLPDKEGEFNLEEEGDKENGKNSRELNKDEVPLELKRKSIERYWNRTLGEIFQETKKDPFWAFMKQPVESKEIVESTDTETLENLKPEADEEKGRNKRSLNYNNHFDTKPFDNAWREPQENTLKYLVKNNIVDQNSEFVKTMLDNSIKKLRIPQYNPLDKRIHTKNSNTVFRELGSSKDSAKEATNFQLVSPNAQKISTPEFTITASNEKSHSNYESDPFQKFYEMAIELIRSALKPFNNFSI